MKVIYLVPITACLLAILVGVLILLFSKRIKPEKNKVFELSELTREGLSAYSRRLFSSNIQIIVYLSLVFFILSTLFGKPFPWIQIITFFIGVSCICLSSWISLSVAPMFIPHVLYRSKSFLRESLNYLFGISHGIGLIITAIVLGGLVICAAIFGIPSIIGFGLGVAFASFFFRIGGSIYKASTDIGSEILPKVEKNIPDFDRRSPATLLDITGDFVGNITGFSSDILSSYIFSLIACLLLPYSLLKAGFIPYTAYLKLVILPLFLFSVGLCSAIISYIFSRWRSESRVDNILLESVYLSVLISGASTYFILDWLNIGVLNIPFLGILGKHKNFYLFLPYLMGLVGAVFISFTSEVLTTSRYKPARNVASRAEFGPVVVLFSALSKSLFGNAMYLLYILLMVLPAFHFAGFYGVAMAGMGMLSVTGTILITKIFFTYSGNAKKFAILGQAHDTIIKNTTRMEDLGNTTTALGNGFATGASSMATFGLFFSMVLLGQVDIPNLFVIDQHLLIGIMIGISLPFIFSGVLLSELNKTILKLIKEASRQFREIPYLYEDKAKPDMIKASDYISRRAMDSMIVPGMLMALLPIVLAYGFGTKLLIGFVLGTFLTGANQGFYWANFGDVLHHAKRHISTGHFGGQESPSYQNVTIADNYGDAFKDLLSPAINILIKSVTILATLLVILLNQT